MNYNLHNSLKAIKLKNKHKPAPKECNQMTYRLSILLIPSHWQFIKKDLLCP